jgi:hypothetical protein
MELVLYGCETWFLALREEYRLRVSENRMRRKWWEAGEHCLVRSLKYDLPDVIRAIKSRRMRWVGHAAHMGCYMRTIFWSENLNGRDKRSRRRCEGSRMDFREIG